MCLRGDQFTFCDVNAKEKNANCFYNIYDEKMAVLCYGVVVYGDSYC